MGSARSPRQPAEDQRAVGPRDPDRLSLTSVDALACEESAVLARGVQARLAVFTRAVGVAEWRDDQVALFTSHYATSDPGQVPPLPAKARKGMPTRDDADQTTRHVLKSGSKCPDAG